jgi:hypothetical protein
MALTWDDVTALTNRAVKKKLQMAWKNAHVLALKLTREGRKKPVMQPYGDGVRFPIMYQASGNATWYTKGTPLPAATTAQLTASQFDYKFLACQAAVDGTELIRNTGPNGVVNLVEGIKANSMASLEDALGTAVYSDGTDSLRVNGVRDLIASATYGNIATADFAGWAAAKDYSSTSNLTLAQLDDIWTAAADGSCSRSCAACSRRRSDTRRTARLGSTGSAASCSTARRSSWIATAPAPTAVPPTTSSSS